MSLTNKERGRLDRLKDRCHVLQARLDANTAGKQDWEQELSALSWAVAKIEAFPPEALPKWISMKERQPADFERVLCVNSNNYMATANRFHDTGMGSWNGSDYTAEEHHDLVIGDITYWMPLPAFPSPRGTR